MNNFFAKFVFNSIQIFKLYFCLFGMFMLPTLSIAFFSRQEYGVVAMLVGSFLVPLVGGAYLASRDIVKTFIDV